MTGGSYPAAPEFAWRRLSDRTQRVLENITAQKPGHIISVTHGSEIGELDVAQPFLNCSAANNIGQIGRGVRIGRLSLESDREGARRGITFVVHDGIRLEELCIKDDAGKITGGLGSAVIDVQSVPTAVQRLVIVLKGRWAYSPHQKITVTADGIQVQTGPLISYGVSFVDGVWTIVLHAVPTFA